MVVSSGLLTLTRAGRLGRGDDKKRGSAWRHFPSLIQPLHYNLLTSGSPQGNARYVGTDGSCVPAERCRGAAGFRAPGRLTTWRRRSWRSPRAHSAVARLGADPDYCSDYRTRSQQRPPDLCPLLFHSLDVSRRDRDHLTVICLVIGCHSTDLADRDCNRRVACRPHLALDRSHLGPERSEAF